MTAKLKTAPAEQDTDSADLQMINSILERLQLEEACPEHDYDRFPRLVGSFLNVAMAAFVVMQDDRHMQYVKAQYGFPEDDPYKEVMPLEYSFGRHVKRYGKPLIIESTPKCKMVSDNPSIHEFGVHAYLGVPVFGLDNLAIGALSALDTVERVWHRSDVQTMKDLAGCITVQVKLRLMRDPGLDLSQL